MKPLSLVLALLCLASTLYSQYVYTIKADSVKITNNCDTAELILENHTQNVLGFLYNKGKGRTEFREIVKLDDSTLLFGEDTLLIRGRIGSASNGLSLFENDVRLGQSDGDPNNPAILTEDREIPMDAYTIKFSNYPGGLQSAIRPNEIYVQNNHGCGGRDCSIDIGAIGATLNADNLSFNAPEVGESAAYGRTGFTFGTSGKGVKGDIVGTEARLHLYDYESGFPTIWFEVGASNTDVTVFNDNGNLRFRAPTTTTPPASVLTVSIANERVGIITANPAFALDVTGSGNFSDSLLVGTMEDGAASDNVVVWDNSSKLLKKIPQSGLGSTINRHAVSDANYTATSSNYLIAYVSISTGRTVTLPAASSMTNKTIIIKDESGSAGTHNITIDGFGSETIDGSTTKVISSNFGSITMYSNGSDWFTIHS